MSRFAFVGPSYTSRSMTADAQTCRNFYIEVDESGQGKSAQMLYSTPGLQVFAQLPGQSVRAEFTINGRGFAVSGPALYEVLANGNSNKLGAVIDDGLPASMAASPQELIVSSGGAVYVFFLQAVGNNAAGTFLQIPAATFPGLIAQVGYCRGFFLALVVNSQQIMISNALDATTWPAVQFIAVSDFPDNIVAFKVSQTLIWIQGLVASEVYFASASLNIFDPIQGSFMQSGLGAQFSQVIADNALFWIEQDERGGGIVRRASGYTPVRVSNHAVELAMQGYATFTDAIAYSYQDQGHTFVQFYFPTANKTWVYDVATQMWHEKAFWNQALGVDQAHRSRCHMYCFGKHLVGDWASGTIYWQSTQFLTDFGNAIRRTRRAPHISTENQWMFHEELFVDIEVGLGPQPPLLDGAGNPRSPQVMLRWSDDSGKTWSNEHWADAGQAGEYRTRVIWRRLGSSRDRIYELFVSDPISWSIIDAYLKAEPGFSSQERLAKTYGKVS